MGGWNSGPYNYLGEEGKKTVNKCCALDIRQWKREGLLNVGNSFVSTWKSQKNKQMWSIRVYVPAEDKIILSYTVTINEQEHRPIKTLVSLGFSECNYGGRRYWIHCPGCFKRVALLYLDDINFKCRHCHALTYQSCQESGNLTDEQVRRVNHVLTKLKNQNIYGFDIIDYMPRRPKGMHWKTYQRLRRQYEDEQIGYIQAVTAHLGVLNARWANLWG